MDEDEAVARLRASDPAAEAEPDAERLAERTAQRRGDELANRRARRSPRWVTVAAVAAGALVVGGVGFGIGRASDGEPASQAEGDSHLATFPGTATEEAPAEGSPMAAADMAIAPGFGERTTFTASGLDDAAGTAPAWAFDGAAVFSEESAARAAEVFGVEGEPRLEGSWNVGSDENGPVLNLNPDGAVTISFYDHRLYGDVMPVEPMPLPEPEEDGDGVSGSEGSDEPAADSAPADGVPGGDPTAAPDTAVEGESAVGVMPASPGDEEPSAVEPDGAAPDGPAGVLYETLAALGLDPDAAAYSTGEHWSGGEVTSVVAHQLVGGERTGFSWSADVTGDGILSFNGPLAPLTELGDYDVVSPAEAVERLGDPRFGATPVWTDDVAILQAEPETPGRSWDDPPPAAPDVSSPVPWPVSEVTIVEADLALTQHGTDDGGVLLLPAYELSDGDGRTWSVLAVADHELAF